LVRDYTRPDLPSGPNETPFAGADIASLAALGKIPSTFFKLTLDKHLISP